MTEPTKSEIVWVARQYLERKLKANEVGTLTPFVDDYHAGEYQIDEWNSRYLALKDAIGSSEYDDWLKRNVAASMVRGSQ